MTDTGELESLRQQLQEAEHNVSLLRAKVKALETPALFGRQAVKVDRVHEYRFGGDSFELKVGPFNLHHQFRWLIEAPRQPGLTTGEAEQYLLKARDALCELTNTVAVQPPVCIGNPENKSTVVSVPYESIVVNVPYDALQLFKDVVPYLVVVLESGAGKKPPYHWRDHYTAADHLRHAGSHCGHRSVAEEEGQGAVPLDTDGTAHRACEIVRLMMVFWHELKEAGMVK